jgi:hypothetical protein
MRHEMLNQRNPFCHHVNAKKGTLSQHFVMHVVPPLLLTNEKLVSLLLDSVDRAASEMV